MFKLCLGKKINQDIQINSVDKIDWHTQIIVKPKYIAKTRCLLDCWGLKKELDRI